MPDPVTNFAYVEALQGYDSAAVSISLVAGGAAKLPDADVDGAYNLVWWNYTDYPDPAEDPDVEIVRVTSDTGEVLTITRAQEGTSAANHNLSGRIYKLLLGVTKKTIDDIVVPAHADTTGQTADDHI